MVESYSESSTIIECRKNVLKERSYKNRLQQEENLIIQAFMEGQLNNISPVTDELQSKGILGFSFVQKDSSTPYDKYLISGYIKVPSNYPDGKPQVFFKPLLPHINVYKVSGEEDVGFHCGDGFQRWQPHTHTLVEALYKARDVVSNPFYEGTSQDCILKKVLIEKSVDFRLYYKDTSIKAAVDKEIIALLDKKFGKFL